MVAGHVRRALIWWQAIYVKPYVKPYVVVLCEALVYSEASVKPLAVKPLDLVQWPTDWRRGERRRWGRWRRRLELTGGSQKAVVYALDREAAWSSVFIVMSCIVKAEPTSEPAWSSTCVMLC